MFCDNHCVEDLLPGASLGVKLLHDTQTPDMVRASVDRCFIALMYRSSLQLTQASHETNWFF